VVKPNNEGSSVGVYIVREGRMRRAAVRRTCPTVMVEAYAPGRELTVTVMGDRALCVTDIMTDGWYDYDAKYKPGGSRHVLPADLPAEITACWTTRCAPIARWAAGGSAAPISAGTRRAVWTG
jgi:D-alanine-D-alanine ligase